MGDATVPHTPSGTKGEGCGPLPLETLSRRRENEGRGQGPPLETPPKGTEDGSKALLETTPKGTEDEGQGNGSGKRSRVCPVWNTGMRRTFWCGDVLI